MERPSNFSAIVALTALILVFFTSLPAFVRVLKRGTLKAMVEVPYETSKLYEDEDGIATEEAQKGYTAAVPKYIALSCSMLGLSASMGIAVHTTVHPMLHLCLENWLSVGTWVRTLSNFLIYTN